VLVAELAAEELFDVVLVDGGGLLEVLEPVEAVGLELCEEVGCGVPPR
jgi:hypothetical protein